MNKPKSHDAANQPQPSNNLPKLDKDYGSWQRNRLQRDGIFFAKGELMLLTEQNIEVLHTRENTTRRK